MAEIEIDISLLSANPVDVDSPYANQGANVILSNPAESSVTGATQSLIADIFAVGPSGPTGPQGPSGEMGPSGAVGPSGQINTGELDKRYYSINNPSGFITGVDLSQYATTINLALTGSELNNKINLLSGVTVLKFGNESITGIKDFINRPTVNTIPVLLSGENSNGLSVLVKNDDSVTLQKGQPVYIFGANGNNILVRRAANTGEATSSKTLGLLNQTLALAQQEI
ncbi:collagen-like protein [bacterium]|nr:collagen-like protein [Candidatus Elulimicrobium humile]